MTPRTVRKLSDLEIDEISVVDRPANQHGLVAIAKRDEGTPMTYWDAEGNEVFEDELEHGMTVYDDDDNPMVYVEGDLDELSDDELAELGIEVPDDASELDDDELSPALAKALGISKGRFGGAVSNARTGVERYAGRAARATASGMERHPGRASGAVLATSTGGGFAAGRRSKRRMSKSANGNLGDGIYGALSKAMNAQDAREALRDVADQIGEMLQASTQAAAQSYQIAKALAEEREDETWMQVAADYDLPVDPRQFGGILKRAGRALPPSDVRALDRIFKAAGEAQYFSEQGHNGGFMPGGTHDMVEAAALELVGKSGGNTSKEQAITALYAANPAAYDEYLAEQAGLR